jgi:hypothetical protein
MIRHDARSFWEFVSEFTHQQQKQTLSSPYHIYRKVHLPALPSTTGGMRPEPTMERVICPAISLTERRPPDRYQKVDQATDPAMASAAI